jgi:hypothetical protein
LSDNAFSELRGKLDGNDSFVSGGHRIMKTAGATSHSARMKRVPVWAMDDDKIRQYILCHFPNLNTDPESRRLAARIVRVIHLYYRVGATTGTVAEELKLTITTVEKIIRKLNRGMVKPLVSRGKGKRGPGKKNKRVCVCSTSEEVTTNGRE